MSVTVKNPRGELVDIPELDDGALQLGYQAATPEEIAAAPAEDDTDYESLPQQAATVLEGVAGGASMGVLPWAAQKLGITTPEATQVRAAANPWEHNLGELGGGALPFFLSGGTAAAARGVGAAAKATEAVDAVTGAAKAAEAAQDVASTIESGTSFLSKLRTASQYTAPGVIGKAGEAVRGVLGSGLPGSLASYAAEGALFSGAGMAERQLLGEDPDLTAEQVLTDLGTGALFGTALGGASYGLAKVLPSQAVAAEKLGQQAARWNVRSLTGNDAAETSAFFNRGDNPAYQMQLAREMGEKGLVGANVLPEEAGKRAQALMDMSGKQMEDLSQHASTIWDGTGKSLVDAREAVQPGFEELAAGDPNFKRQMPELLSRLDDYSSTYGDRPLSPADWWKIRSQLDTTIKQVGRDYNSSELGGPLRQMRAYVADQLDASMDKVGLKNSWLSATRGYEVGKAAKSLADTGIVNMAKNASLGSAFSIAGILSGHPVTGMAAQYAKKLVSMYSPGALAVGARKLSDLLAGEDGLAAFYSRVGPRFRGDSASLAPAAAGAWKVGPLHPYEGPIEAGPSSIFHHPQLPGSSAAGTTVAGSGIPIPQTEGINPPLQGLRLPQQAAAAMDMPPSGQPTMPMLRPASVEGQVLGTVVPGSGQPIAATAGITPPTLALPAAHMAAARYGIPTPPAERGLALPAAAPPIELPVRHPALPYIRQVAQVGPAQEYEARRTAQVVGDADKLLKTARQRKVSIDKHLATVAAPEDGGPSRASKALAVITAGSKPKDMAARWASWAQRAEVDPNTAADVLYAPLPDAKAPTIEATPAQQMMIDARDRAMKTMAEREEQVKEALKGKQPRASDGGSNIRVKAKKFFEGGEVTPEKYGHVATNLRYLGDFDTAVDEVMKQTPVLRAEAPQLADAMHRAFMRVKTHLGAKIPQPPQDTYLMDGPFEPTESELHEFNQHKDVADSGPAAVLEHLADGTLTPEHIEASQAMFPKLHAQAVEAVTQAVAEHAADGGDVPHHMRGDIGMLLGKDLDRASAPANILSTQTMFTNGGPQQQSQMLGNTRQRANPRGPRNVKLGIADRAQTASEGVTDRMNDNE